MKYIVFRISYIKYNNMYCDILPGTLGYASLYNY